MRKVKYTQQNYHDRLTQILTDFPKLDVSATPVLTKELSVTGDNSAAVPVCRSEWCPTGPDESKFGQMCSVEVYGEVNSVCGCLLKGAFCRDLAVGLYWLEMPLEVLEVGGTRPHRVASHLQFFRSVTSVDKTNPHQSPIRGSVGNAL